MKSFKTHLSCCRRLALSVVTTAAAFLFTSNSHADLVTVQFEAVITGVQSGPVPGVQSGDTITGRIVYDTSTGDNFPNFPKFGQYSEPFVSVEMHLPGGSYSLVSDSRNVMNISNDQSGARPSELLDRLYVNAYLAGGYRVEFANTDKDGSVFSSDALPLVVPSAAEFEQSEFFVRYGRKYVRGRVTSLSSADTVAPEVSVALATQVLGSRNHALVDVGLSALIEDDRDAAPSVEVLVFSNEAEDTRGSGNTSSDALIGADGSVSLRAERSGRGDGRIYLVVVVATDNAGNTGFDCAAAVVPKSNGKKHLAGVAAAALLAEDDCISTGGDPAGFELIASGSF